MKELGAALGFTALIVAVALTAGGPANATVFDKLVISGIAVAIAVIALAMMFLSSETET